MSSILCLDQSSRISGYSVFDKDTGKLITYGKFSFSDPQIETRLVKIRRKVQSLIEEYQAQELTIEDIQLQGNISNGVTTYKALAQVQGVILELASELGIPVAIVHSASWKSTCGIGGRTRADQKRNAQRHVQITYGLDVTQDEADAICIGEHIMKESKGAW